MQWLLELSAGPHDGSRIDPADVSSSDEFLCGRCRALLAVDHQIWRNAALTGGGITCGVCDAENDPTKGHPLRAADAG